MRSLNLAVSIITYRRSHLLDLCLKSLENAMAKQRRPVYIIVQDATSDDLSILQKYDHLITEVVHTKADGLHVEDLINRNRILAWEMPLIQRGHQYVICLEDDVEVAPDILEFTENVLEQQADSKYFCGINFGSFEKPEVPGSYSKLCFGLHGPASLISKGSLKKFQLNFLQKFSGAIPWDAWVEPIVKRGFVVTSNVARYKDNGLDGTHAKAVNDSEYFRKLNESFEYGSRLVSTEYRNIDIEHTWRYDCLSYTKSKSFRLYLKFLVVRMYQIFFSVKKILSAQF